MPTPLSGWLFSVFVRAEETGRHGHGAAVNRAVSSSEDHVLLEGPDSRRKELWLVPRGAGLHRRVPHPAFRRPARVAGITMTPQTGDVLVSNVTATVEYDVSLVGGPVVFTGMHYAAAVARAHELATECRVAAWLTEDHTHFLKIVFCHDAIGERV
jgi:hypothetical protein